jgi:8-oxo-dGTP diphosphatase
VPVASSVVVNEAREVLLVRRKSDPHRGRWCLPGGFPQPGETIEEATVRELHEQTGLRGHVRRILGAEWQESGPWGDLLFVTLEVEAVAGTSRAGRGSGDVAWFGVDATPPLAFAPHEAALRTALALHEEAWSIQDSFERLHTDTGEEMLSDALVSLVRDNAHEISRRWLETVCSSPSTPTYRRADRDGMQTRAMAALSRFRFWLSGDEADAEIRSFYRALGREWREQGFELPEVLSALTLLRKEIWTFAREFHVQERTLDFYRVMELNRRIVLFFDKALYHTSRGYCVAG